MDSVAGIVFGMLFDDVSVVNVSQIQVLTHLLQRIVEFFIISENAVGLYSFLARRRNTVDQNNGIRRSFFEILYQTFIFFYKVFDIDVIVSNVIHAERESSKAGIGVCR